MYTTGCQAGPERIWPHVGRTRRLFPDDLDVERSGVCFVDGQDELDYLWYRLREREGGREYAGYRVVRLLQLSFLPLEARADPGLLQKMRTVLRGLYGSQVNFLYLAAGIFNHQQAAGGDRAVLWRLGICHHAGRGLRPIDAQPGSAQRSDERRLPPDPFRAADGSHCGVDLPELPRYEACSGHRRAHRSTRKRPRRETAR